MHKFSISILLLLLITAVSSCDKNRVYDEYKSLPDYWHKDSLVSFQVKDLDTVKAFNLFINLRNNNNYNYNNIFLIASMNFPNGKVITDTLEYKMTHPDGNFIGEGFGEIKENKLWYKQGVTFAEEGAYKFSIKHAVRKNGEVKGVEKLDGITEVGFRIENTNP